MKVLVEYDLEYQGRKLSINEADANSILDVPSTIEEDQISDWISDRTGWCVLRWEKILPLRRGDLVLIKSQKYTEKTYGINEDMIKEVGTVQTVKDADEYSVHAGCGFWKRQDIQKISGDSKIGPNAKPVLFDVKELYV